MPKLPIPDWGHEYPDYVYRPWPKWVGIDAEGNHLEAESEEEFRRLKEIAVYPKVLGKDRDGKDVVAQSERDEKWFASRVVKAVAAPVENALTEEAPRRGPGRPPKEAAA